MQIIPKSLSDFLSTEVGLVVVTTNLVVRANGNGVLGAGVALAARTHFAAKGRDLEAEYGRFLREALDKGETLEGRVWLSKISPVVYMPTKRHFRDPTPLDLLERNLRALNALCAKSVLPVAVPLAGAGNGGLTEADSEALMRRLLTAPCFRLLRPGPAPTAASALAQAQLTVAGRKTLFITGHRPHKLGGYAPDVRGYTRDFFIRVTEAWKPDVVVSGMAQGADMGLAEAAEYLGIPLIAAVPCREHESKWPQAAQEAYRRVLEYAQRTGGVHYVHDGPYNGPRCMLARDQWMIDLLAHAGPASAMITLHNGDEEGGTAQTLRMLKQSGGRFGGNYWNRFVAGHPSEPFRSKYKRPGTGAPAARTEAA